MQQAACDGSGLSHWYDGLPEASHKLLSTEVEVSCCSSWEEEEAASANDLHKGPEMQPDSSIMTSKSLRQMKQLSYVIQQQTGIWTHWCFCMSFHYGHTCQSADWHTAHWLHVVATKWWSLTLYYNLYGFSQLWISHRLLTDTRCVPEPPGSQSKFTVGLLLTGAGAGSNTAPTGHNLSGYGQLAAKWNIITYRLHHLILSNTYGWLPYCKLLL